MPDRISATPSAKAGRPNCVYRLGRLDEEHLGAFLQMLEFQTAFTGEFLNINAFDQEGVELGKRFTSGLMGRPGFDRFRWPSAFPDVCTVVGQHATTRRDSGFASTSIFTQWNSGNS